MINPGITNKDNDITLPNICFIMLLINFNKS